jgi:hypothetical protein
MHIMKCLDKKQSPLILGVAMLLASSSSIFAADVTINYSEFSKSPSIGKGGGQTDPNLVSTYGAASFFVKYVAELTSDKKNNSEGKVTFMPGPEADAGLRAKNALRSGVQYSNGKTASNPTWNFIYNSVPFGMTFEQTKGFFYEKQGNADKTGLELAQDILDHRATPTTQIFFPIVGGNMQGSGYFTEPVGTPQCNKGDKDCKAYGTGVGLKGLCEHKWKLRYLPPSENILDKACTNLFPSTKNLTFYPSIQGQPVLLPMQLRTITGFEFTSPIDDLQAFFPAASLKPDNLNCGPVVTTPPNVGLSADAKSTCTQNIGQIGTRFAHYPAWHQPLLFSFMHIDKTLWNEKNDKTQAGEDKVPPDATHLGKQQRFLILKAARKALDDSFKASDSVECKNLKALLQFNKGQVQLDNFGNRLDKSADMTLVRWPDAALADLKTATEQFIASQAGISSPDKIEFTKIWNAYDSYRTAKGFKAFNPGTFPAAGCDIIPKNLQ